VLARRARPARERGSAGMVASTGEWSGRPLGLSFLREARRVLSKRQKRSPVTWRPQTRRRYAEDFSFYVKFSLYKRKSLHKRKNLRNNSDCRFSCNGWGGGVARPEQRVPSIALTRQQMAKARGHHASPGADEGQLPTLPVGFSVARATGVEYRSAAQARTGEIAKYQMRPGKSCSALRIWTAFLAPGLQMRGWPPLAPV